MDPRYRLEAEHDGEAWVVTFPALRGCVGRGYSIEEAIDAAKFAQEDHLTRFATAKELSEQWQR